MKVTAQTTNSSSAIQHTTWSGVYGGADKSYDTTLLAMREMMATKFQTLTFEDKPTGRTMTYNLFVPKDYDAHQKYPLVLFMADASTVGKGAMAPLKQGYGGFIWATDENQAEHPCFVLVPSYEGPDNVTNDQWQVTDEAAVTLRLLHHIVATYSVDTDRLYTTGQSMGGMLSFYFNTIRPDLFAASLFVGSQWDTDVLDILVNKKFCYIVSEADPKASKGMRELGELLKQKGVSYGFTKFSAKLSEAEKDAKVEALLAEGKPINFVQFEQGTVLPTTTVQRRGGGEHMYSFDYAYLLGSVRSWLFHQSK